MDFVAKTTNLLLTIDICKEFQQLQRRDIVGAKKIEYRLTFLPHCVTHEKDFKIQSKVECVRKCRCMYLSEREEEQQRLI